jgi:hypothetical protein
LRNALANEFPVSRFTPAGDSAHFVRGMVRIHGGGRGETRARNLLLARVRGSERSPNFQPREKGVTKRYTLFLQLIVNKAIFTNMLNNFISLPALKIKILGGEKR